MANTSHENDIELRSLRRDNGNASHNNSTNRLSPPLARTSSSRQSLVRTYSTGVDVSNIDRENASYTPDLSNVEEGVDDIGGRRLKMIVSYKRYRLRLIGSVLVLGIMVTAGVISYYRPVFEGDPLLANRFLNTTANAFTKSTEALSKAMSLVLRAGN